MAKQKIETSIEINGIDVVAYPLVESDHVTFENGMSINEMIKGDVVTPVVTHEETSFKVGKGDSDVSSSIVDSSVGEMIIKGQTYQNILPEPSLRNSMSNGKTMQKFNEGYDNVNVVDGVGKNAILKGQTLVNLSRCEVSLQCGDISRFSNIISNPNYLSAEISSSLAGTWTYVKCEINLQFLKPNTKYLVKFEQLSEFTGHICIAKGDATKQLTNAVKCNPSVILTTISELEKVNQCLYISVYSSVPVGTRIVVSNPMLLEYQEGMENWDIPYFEGMQSVKMPVLSTTGKNLFDLDNVAVKDFNGVSVSKINGGFKFNTKLEGKTWRQNIVSFFNLKPNTQYVYSVRKTVHMNPYNGATPTWGAGYVYIHDMTTKTVLVERKLKDNDITQITFTTKANSNIRIYHTALSDIPTQDGEFDLTDFQLEEGSTATTYEPYKSNTLTTPSDLTLRRIGDVYDTLDLVSGEKVERIGVGVFDGSDDEVWYVEKVVGDYTTFVNYKPLPNIKGSSYTLCDKLLGGGSKGEYHSVQPFGNYINILTSKASNVSSFRNWLKQNELTICYPLETPIVKTVDLSSSGNWEKVVLDGSENWRLASTYNNTIRFAWDNLNVAIKNGNQQNIFSDKFVYSLSGLDIEGIDTHSNSNTIQITILKSKLSSGDISGFKQYLQANPVTVWYQTTTHKDSTQVKQLLSFSNGHIQLSSEKGSLIPSLDYEVPTSNSYHLDLAKTSTQYTMKNMSETFTIDGTQYNASANGTFTTPSSMTNKLMITSVTQSNAMLLEGNLTSKTIPYFKGIKSAFEGKDKIEVLSTGRKLVNLDNAILNSNHQKVVTKIENGFNIKFTYNPNNFSGWDNAIRLRVDVKPNTNYVLSLTKIVRKDPYQGITPLPLWVSGYTWVRQGDSHHDSLTEGNLTNGLPTVMKFNSRNFNYVTLDICSTPSRPAQDGDFDIVDIQIEESPSATPYEPYKSNITKIPLSSPLRSLPNGVRDEVILDRENNKVKVIQRVGDIFVNGSEKWNNMEITTPTNYVLLADNRIKCGNDRHFNNVSSSFPVQSSYDRSKENCYVAYKNQLIFTPFTERFRNLQEFKQWLSQNPTTVYYELETPIITEIDLDGYPYIYKDGHIFLNSKIAPTTTMKYSINQSHQIASQNGDLIRHEKEINYLYTLIAKYVNVQYESTLLNLDLELSRA